MFASVSLVSSKERELLQSLEKELYAARDNEDAMIEIKMRSLKQGPISLALLTELMTLEIEIKSIIDKGTESLQQRLETAVRWNLCLEVAIFLRLGADVNALSLHHQDYLEMSTSEKMAELLIECGYNIRRISQFGETVLHNCVGFGHVEVVRFLLDTGETDVMSRTPQLLSTPLHNCYHPRVVELLLSHGADPNAVDVFGATPFCSVGNYGDWRCFLLLIVAGGDWTKPSNSNITPIQSLENTLQSHLEKFQKETEKEKKTYRIGRCIELLKYFQCALEHSKFSLTPSNRPQFISDTILSLTWKSQGLLCKDPLLGYMDATRLPRELMDIVLTYVGLTNLEKTGKSYSELALIQNIKREAREKQDTERAWYDNYGSTILNGCLITGCVILTIAAILLLRAYTKIMIAMEDVI